MPNRFNVFDVYHLLSLCVFLFGWTGQAFGARGDSQHPASRPASFASKARSYPGHRPRAYKSRQPLTVCEKSNYLATVHPKQVMAFYRQMAQKSPWLKIIKLGVGDGKRPIHLVVLSKQRRFVPKQRTNQVVVMSNNGIHSGESCGIDATQMLIRDLLAEMKHSTRYDNLIFVTIPVFNVGGHIQFRSHNRANQKGPIQMGFRGNARNYDLNRDFAKADTANMRAFYKAFHTWKPHIFIDNHTTNGADYQHVMTYTIAPKEPLPPSLRKFVYGHLKPALEQTMRKSGYPLIPYVVLKKRHHPQKGIQGWISPARFSTGLTRLFNTIPILSEAHMLKTYKQRVLGTYTFNRHILGLSLRYAKALRQARQEADRFASQRRTYTLRWKQAKGHSMVRFDGFVTTQKRSFVSGALHVHYDRNQPKSWVIPYFDRHKAALVLKVPKAYIIPQQWTHVIQRLRWNGVKMKTLPKDQTIQVERSIITNIKWHNVPYEGHFRPHSIKTIRIKRSVHFHKGDWVVPTNQPSSAYIMELLEPLGRDSFMSWNVFDTIFQQKEYFSSYLFYKTADRILQKDRRLRQIFIERLRKEPSFAKSPRKRLQFIYQSSPYYEPTHNVYPIARIP